MSELRPCPFCGSAPYDSPQNDDCPLPAQLREPGGPAYYQAVWCENCGAEGGKRSSEAEAIAAWNLRAPSSAEQVERASSRVGPVGGEA